MYGGHARERNKFVMVEDSAVTLFYFSVTYKAISIKHADLGGDNS